jgi:adenylate cyclase
VIILSPEKTLRVQRWMPAPPSAPEQHSLAEATIPPRSPTGSGSRLPNLVGSGHQASARDVLQWLHCALDVLQAAAGSDDFFERAARAAIDTVALDAARVLLLEDGVWKDKTARAQPGSDSTPFGASSQTILDRVRTLKKVTWEGLSGNCVRAESLAGVDTVVAAPILDRDNEVIGVLYGERRQRMRAGVSAFGEPEARLVEVLARGVAAGLARLEEERKAISARVQMEQFFTPDLARQLLDHPDLLEGRDREVTILFCDIRGFSRISEKLGAAQTIKWCRDVLDLLSESVLEEGGVVVDYVGDGLMAMWGAPGEQPDHPARACRAALTVLDRLPSLDEKWRSLLGEPTGLGIGINTGTAQVGNVGSRFKFKYGALGNTVNLASRVQGATKFFKCKVLLTGHTQEKLAPSVSTRKLGRVKVIGIAQDIELFELFPRHCPFAADARREYEVALTTFEREQFAEAARTLGNWRGKCPEDDAVLALMYRAVEALVKGKPAGHPVWELPDK